MNKNSREEVYKAIDKEREMQNEYWLRPETPTSAHSNLEFLILIKEYVNAALRNISIGIMYDKTNRDVDMTAKHSQCDLRKIASLAVAALEQNGIESK